jgi:putative membrane protein
MTGLAKLIGVAGMLLPGWAWAQTPPEPGRYDWGHPMMGWGWGGMIFGPILMILVFAATIAVAVLLVRWIAGPGAPPHSASQGRTPLDILKERFACGEIDQKEFEERRRVLGE